MADDPRAVLAQIRERAEKAGDELDRLTEGAGPAANWRWGIPARPERDSDLLIGASQADVPRLARALEAVLDLVQYDECHEDLGDRPCDASAFAVRVDRNHGNAPYPVCIKHARQPLLALGQMRDLITDALEAKP